ncbi:BREX-1 system adenine-specific DNA-methyltransferase PglX [Enorma burkinafasonensis]|uniref:BREX-1 system adenine-specific DNA-methyltransferase PglX n=1 Tax=Enorma burkinafasonensis TaxID=2590867 RepID=UPI0011AAD356|nr:BREX-1 system adenine-specific DNA-methyltransferase PglX [Enorma burkinafasonensis]
MDTKVLEKFCPWARRALIDAVHNRFVKFSLDDAGRTAYPAGSDVIGTGVIDTATKAQRDGLYARIEKAGYSAFCQQMAYTWFNRFAGIRYMELHGFLSNGVRMLSAQDGRFDPECLRAVGELELAGLDRERALDLAAEGSDSELFRLILIAQCNELADALPDVFSHVGAADELTLPDGLLNRNENNVLYHLVTDIPEEAWQDVEILGWMYQFYNAELKADFFKSKRKAAVEDIAPATQLFTPEWILRYMVDNSLGRLWMLNFPESALPERAHAENPADRLMEYYIVPDREHEDFIRIAGPEGITFCDPACGSGHILVYAFKMLFALYEERGYREREIPELILTKNLAGLEIDPRAAQIAQLALALCAREHDRRFFTRNVTADVQVLESVELDTEQLGDEQLAETLAHLSEVGSLFTPSDTDIALLEAQKDSSSAAGLFAEPAGQSVERALTACKALSRRFDVVVANPPYMGSSSFNPFVSKWVKKHYPDVKSDLFAAFIVRIMDFAKEHGEIGIMSPFVWMFIGSYEKLRNRLIDEKTLTSLIQLEYSGFAGATVPICTFTFHNSYIPGYRGGYVRLADFVGPAVQGPKALEAIQNPDCGWFYRADATRFHDMPGSPIAYWASSALHDAFLNGKSVASYSKPKCGLSAGTNELFLRKWWEVSHCSTCYSARDAIEAKSSTKRWFPCNKGGSFRKWEGNNDDLIDWQDDGQRIRNYRDDNGRLLSRPLNLDTFFNPSVTWSAISSGDVSFRYRGPGYVYEHAGASLFGTEADLAYLQGACNSSVIRVIAGILSPTLNFQIGQIASYPILDTDESVKSQVISFVLSLRKLSKSDWDSQETSWDFAKNPLV